MEAEALPVIIQGGMGIGISSWPLARAVSEQGQLGVVSGTALDNLLIRRLQDGDIGGNLRRAMDAFPSPAVASETLKRFFKPEGRAEGRVAPPSLRANLRPARKSPRWCIGV